MFCSVRLFPAYADSRRIPDRARSGGRRRRSTPPAPGRRPPDPARFCLTRDVPGPERLFREHHLCAFLQPCPDRPRPGPVAHRIGRTALWRQPKRIRKATSSPRGTGRHVVRSRPRRSLVPRDDGTSDSRFMPPEPAASPSSRPGVSGRWRWGRSLHPRRRLVQRCRRTASPASPKRGWLPNARAPSPRTRDGGVRPRRASRRAALDGEPPGRGPADERQAPGASTRAARFSAGPCGIRRDAPLRRGDRFAPAHHPQLRVQLLDVPLHRRRRQRVPLRDLLAAQPLA